MRRFSRLVLLVGVAIIPAVASAQPAEPNSSESGSDSVGGTGTGVMDEARVKELVDKELDKILNDRAAREAAERAARDDQSAETTSSSSPGDLTGASGFMDTRLAFTLTNENVLVQPGETIPSVPGWRFGTPNSLGVLFFDNYDTRYSGFETMSHAVMYRDFSKGHLQAEGAFVLRINEISEKTLDLSNAGAYITLSNWKDPTHKDPTRISLTA